MESTSQMFYLFAFKGHFIYKKNSIAFYFEKKSHNIFNSNDIFLYRRETFLNLNASCAICIFMLGIM